MNKESQPQKSQWWALYTENGNMLVANKLDDPDRAVYFNGRFHYLRESYYQEWEWALENWGKEPVPIKIKVEKLPNQAIDSHGIRHYYIDSKVVGRYFDYYDEDLDRFKTEELSLDHVINLRGLTQKAT